MGHRSVSTFTRYQPTSFRKRVEAQIKEIGGKLDRKKAEVRTDCPGMHTKVDLPSSASQLAEIQGSIQQLNMPAAGPAITA